MHLLYSIEIVDIIKQVRILVGFTTEELARTFSIQFLAIKNKGKNESIVIENGGKTYRQGTYKIMFHKTVELECPEACDAILSRLEKEE